MRHFHLMGHYPLTSHYALMGHFNFIGSNNWTLSLKVRSHLPTILAIIGTINYFIG